VSLLLLSAFFFCLLLLKLVFLSFSSWLVLSVFCWLFIPFRHTMCRNQKKKKTLSGLKGTDQHDYPKKKFYTLISAIVKILRRCFFLKKEAKSAK
jgi:hypothetical protein